jgi:hypothetical protein
MELRLVAVFISAIMVSWLVSWLLKAYFFKKWMIGDLLLIFLCIILIIMFYRLRGIITFSVSLLVFTVFAVLGVFSTFYGFIPFLSEISSGKIDSETIVIRMMPHLVNLLTGVLSTCIVFILLTSEGLNSYLGTEAVFSSRRGKQ